MKDQILEHRKIFFSTDKWPQFPLLPLIRRDHEQSLETQLGFVLAPNITKVYCGNMFERDTKNLETIDYASVDDLLNDGWIID